MATGSNLRRSQWRITTPNWNYRVRSRRGVTGATNNRSNHVSGKISMKVTIIGGGGRVGSCAAFALQCAGLVGEIQILDANKDMAEGEALDLIHGSAFAGDQKIYAGDYNRAADSDIFLITAG